MDDSKLCMRCFEPLQEALACGACGWHPAISVAHDGELGLGAKLRERYLVGRVLGRGGFGITYLGWDTLLQRKRAIKEYFPRGVVTRPKDSTRITVVSGQTTLHSEGIEKFLDEARRLAQFDNEPHVVSVRDFFEENGTAYLVMELLVGETLAHYVERNGGRVLYEHALHFLEPVIQTLSTLHGEGLLHRDVSPENIFLTVQNQAKLLDFGAARQRSPGQARDMTVIVRENYAPPEQYTKAGKQGPWTDVYALACTLYRAITGHHPPRSMDRLVGDPLEPPSALGVDIPPECERALMAGLALRPEDRPSLEALLRGLRMPLEAEAEAVKPPPVKRTPVPLATRLAPALDFARQTGAVARARASAWVALARPHLATMSLLAAIASAVVTLAVLWSRLPSAPAAPSPAVASAPRPEQPQPQPAQEVTPPVSERELLPGPVGPVEPPVVEPAPPLTDPNTANATPAPALEPEPPIVALGDTRLVVRSKVEGDMVEIDGKEVGPSGRKGFEVAPGVHEVRVRKEGYLPFETRYDVPAGKTSTLAVDLKPDKAYLGGIVNEGRRLLRSKTRAEWQLGLERLRAAAELGSADAESDLGLVFAYGSLDENGGGVFTPNDAEALKYHRRAAQRNVVAVQNRLAERLEDGTWPLRGAPKTPEVAAKPEPKPGPSITTRVTEGAKSVFRSVFGGSGSGGEAETPSKDPKPFLEALQTNQRPGRPADFPEAFRWHLAAAKGGHAGSQKRVGFMFAAGRGTERNEFNALEWFLRAARKNDAEAQFVSGMCYSLGEGYGANREAALCWLRKAAAQDHEPARAALVEMGFDPAANGGWTKNVPKECKFAGP